VHLRDAISGAFEEAERASDPTARDEWLRFVVVGGGPTGVEISGQLAILARRAMKKEFRRIVPGAAEVILVDAGRRVVPAFSEPTSANAAKELGRRGAWPARSVKVSRARRHRSSTSTKVRSLWWASDVRCAR